MKIKTSQLVELIQESIQEVQSELLLEVSGMGMGSDGSRPASPMPAGPTRRFDPKAAEAFAAQYNYDFDKIANLQNDEKFMSNSTTRQAFANFNDYAATNLPPNYKSKWQAAVAKANAAAKSQLSQPGMLQRIGQKVAGKVQQAFGAGKPASAETIKEIETLIGKVISENQAAEQRMLAKLQEIYG